MRFLFLTSDEDCAPNVTLGGYGKTGGALTAGVGTGRAKTGNPLLRIPGPRGSLSHQLERRAVLGGGATSWSTEPYLEGAPPEVHLDSHNG